MAKTPKFIVHYNALMEHWDSLSNSQQEVLNIVLKGVGL